MKVLIAHDDDSDRETLRRLAAAWRYEVVTAGSGDAAWSLLEDRNPPSIAILNWDMPGMGGVEICRRIRARNFGSHTHVILCSSAILDGELADGLRAGADDFLTKPYSLQALRWRIESGRRLLQVHRELADSREVFCSHDSLTSVWNRTAIIDFLQRELARAVRTVTPVAALTIGLDGLKQINDAYGRAAGDLVLRETSTRIRSILRIYDSLGRISGEEFLVVAPNCDGDGGKRLARRIQDAVAQRPVIWKSQPIAVRASVGVAAANAPRPEMTDALMSEAESALDLARKEWFPRVELHSTL